MRSRSVICRAISIASSHGRNIVTGYRANRISRSPSLWVPTRSQTRSMRMGMLLPNAAGCSLAVLARLFIFIRYIIPTKDRILATSCARYEHYSINAARREFYQLAQPPSHTFYPSSTVAWPGRDDLTIRSRPSHSSDPVLRMPPSSNPGWKSISSPLASQDCSTMALPTVPLRPRRKLAPV